MKRKVVISTKFKRDLEIARKSKTFKVEVFEEVLEKLISDIPLDEKFKDHWLQGKMKKYRDCHIHPDWVLIYAKTDLNELKILELVRLGSHSNVLR